MKYGIHWGTAEELFRGHPQHLTMVNVNTEHEAIEILHEHAQNAAVRDLMAGASEDEKTTRVWITSADAPQREICGFGTATPFHPMPTVFPSPAPFNEVWAHIHAIVP